MYENKTCFLLALLFYICSFVTIFMENHEDILHSL